MSVKSFAKVSAFTIVIALWTSVAFISAQVAASLVLLVVTAAFPVVGSINQNVMVGVFAALAYTLALLAAVYIPMLVRIGTTKSELGIGRAIQWKDLGYTLLSIVPYLLLSVSLVVIFKLLWSSIDTEQAQEIPFSDLYLPIHYIVAFITLVVMAPVAEELLFRGYLLGKLKAKINPYAAVVISSLVFGAMHLPAKDIQWAVGIDTFALGLVLGYLRIKTDSVWSGILLHATKNAVAFYFLFINPYVAGML